MRFTKRPTSQLVANSFLVAGMLPLLASCSTFNSIAAYFKAKPVAQPVEVAYVPIEGNVKLWQERIARAGSTTPAATAPKSQDVQPQSFKPSPVVVDERPETLNSAPASLSDGGYKLKLDTQFASATRILPFAFALSTPGPKAQRIIREMSVVAKGADAVYVRGRTDNSGDILKNEKLAQARAIAVKELFVRNGVAEQKLQISHCTSCHIADNATDTGRGVNRRVDVEIIAPAKQFAGLDRAQYVVAEVTAPQLRSSGVLLSMANKPTSKEGGE